MLRSGLFFSLIVLIGIVVAQTQNSTQPTESQIFGYLMNESDWTDVLFICNFLKTKDYSCDVTFQGAEFLKNKTIKATAPKSHKIAIHDVTGKWSENDGLLKKSYFTSDTLNIVAKCFFHTEYFECFGIPKCTPDEPAGPCQGGQPWRGKYIGTPAVGFQGSITMQSMMGAGGPAEIPSNDSSVKLLVNSEVSGNATTQKESLLSAPLIQETQDEFGSKKISAFMSSPDKNSQVNITVWTSGNDSKAQAFSASVAQSSSSHHRNSFTNTLPFSFFDSLFQKPTSLFANPFFSSVSDSFVSDKDENATNNDQLDTNFTVWTSGNEGSDQGFGASVQSPSVPQELGGLGNIFGNNFFQSLLPNPATWFSPLSSVGISDSLGNGKENDNTSATKPHQRPEPPVVDSFADSFQPEIQPASNSNSPCERRSASMFLDFGQVRCIIQNFQDRLVNQLWSSFPQVTLDLTNPSPLKPINPKFQGFKIVMTPIREPEQGNEK